jgi:hypothetical protein
MATGSWGGALTQRVFRANIKFRHGGSDCQTGFYLRDVGINTLSPEDVANEVYDFAKVQFRKLMHNTDVLQGVDVTNLVTTEGFSKSEVGVAGIQPGTPCPSYVTVPVALKGSIRKRYGSGRMLWPVPSVESLSGNTLVGATAAVLSEIAVDMASRFLGSGIGDTMTLIHLHPAFTPKNKSVEVPATWYDITSIRVSSITSSLRRRKTGAGS